jgi:hypothetical protein
MLTKTRRYFLFCFVMILLSFSACKPTTEEAEDYYDKVLDIQQAVLDKEAVFIQGINQEMGSLVNDSAVAVPTPETDSLIHVNINDTYTGFCAQIDTSMKRANALEPFDGKPALKNALLQLLREYDLLSGKEYKDVYKIAVRNRLSQTNDEFNRFETITNKIDSILEVKVEAFISACKDFARENNFELYQPPQKANVL